MPSIRIDKTGVAHFPNILQVICPHCRVHAAEERGYIVVLFDAELRTYLLTGKKAKCRCGKEFSVPVFFPEFEDAFAIASALEIMKHHRVLFQCNTMQHQLSSECIVLG